MMRRTSSLRLSFPSCFGKPLRGSLLAFAGLVLAAGLHAQSASQSQNAAAAAPDTPYRGVVVDNVIAQVNDEIISSADYQRAEQELEQQAAQQNWSQDRLADARTNMLRDLIDNQLLLSKGKQLGITGEAETVRQLDEIRKQNHLDSMEALEQAAQQQNVNFADFKASIQNRIITSEVVRDEVGRRINVTQNEEQQYYDAHKGDFTSPETVRLSEILIPTADADNAAQVDAAQKKADAIEAELKTGRNFGELAKQDSSGSTASQGGALGEYKPGQLPKIFEDDTFQLPVGQYTAPVRTKQGFVILKVDGHTAPGLQSFAAVQPQVQEAVGMQMMQPALRDYLTQLREEAYMDVRPGYVDSGASKNETHPIYSAYQPPQPKKKKKRVVRRYGEHGRPISLREASLRRNAGSDDAAGPATASAAVAAPAPAGVPSLADVANGKGNGAQVAVKAQKPGKREKVRFGQAPRETLPAAKTQQESGGATETASNAPIQSQVQGPDATDGGDAQPAPDKKTRYSARAFESHMQKKQRKAAEVAAKKYPYQAAPATTQELADEKQQDQPLGLAGDMTKKKPKPKPASKTRYSDEAFDKTKPTPATASQPSAEPSTQTGVGTNAPVQTQTTPTGSGDPLGPNTPPAPPVGQANQPQR